MSRISPPGDRPIAAHEPKLATQQISETESIQNMETAGQLPEGDEQAAKKEISSSPDKGQQYESRLGGLARQAELESQFPTNPAAPKLIDLPVTNPNLDPNVHLDEKIDLTKNLPDGMSINKGLEGLDWGPSKAKTGPGHFGVEMTYGGMKAPTDVLSEFRNGGKPDNSAPQTGGGGFTTGDNSGIGDGSKGSSGSFVGGTGMKRPGWDLIAADKDGKAGGKSFKQIVSDVVDVVVDVAMEKFGPAGGGEAMGLLRGPELVKEVTGDSADLLRGVEGVVTGGNQVKAANKLLEDDKTMVDPNADGGEPSAEDVERMVKVRAGAVKQGVNPDLGVGGGPMQQDPIKADRNFGVIDKNPDYIETTLDKPNLGNIAQPETRPELQGGPKPDAPPGGAGDPNSNPS